MKLAIVLVEPRGDANIGATARAMKNFGFFDMRLVNPVPHLTSPAYTWAVDAKDILESARVFSSLDDALSDVAYAAAFTRRTGRGRKRHMAICEATPILAARSCEGGAALVFGREDKGLSNEEIKRCDSVLEIPTCADLPSLNLAQSVLLGCYELRNALERAGGQETARHEINSRAEEKFVSRAEILSSLNLIDSMLESLGYEDTPDDPLKSKILAQFERIFGRAGLTPRDAGMIEGLTARVSDVLSHKLDRRR